MILQSSEIKECDALIFLERKGKPSLSSKISTRHLSTDLAASLQGPGGKISLQSGLKEHLGCRTEKALRFLTSGGE